MRSILKAIIGTTGATLLIQASAIAQGAAGRITDVSVSNASIHVQFETVPGNSYQLQQIGDLTTRWWGDEGKTVVATATTIDSAVTNHTACSFFRVLEFTNSVFWYDWGYRHQSPYLSSWGLGSVEEAYWHQDRPYDWYIDQAHTGAASGNNCGPSSVTMAIKWHDVSFAGTAEDARDWSYGWRGNGWWYTSDIINYLNLHAIPNTTSSFVGAAQLQGLISEGYILILCINTGYLSYNTNGEERIDRFYTYAGGHFLVVKGARSVSGSSLFEVYDPNNWDHAYSDGSPKGRNRHFVGAELEQAIENWWNYIIVVKPPSGGPGGVGTLSQQASNWLVPVDPDTIEHAHGM